MINRRGRKVIMSFAENKNKIRLFGEIFKTMSWAIDILKDYKVRLYIYIVLLVLQSIYTIFMTSKVGSVVDLALADNKDALVVTGASFVFLFAMNIVITIACNRFASHNYNGMFNELEMKVYRKIMNASWQDLVEYHSGDIITRLSSDIKTVAGNTSGLVPTMIAKLSLIIGAGIFIVYLDYSMIFLGLIIAPFILVASRVFMGKIYRYEGKIREIESKINSYNVEAFDNIHAIKAFGLGDYFSDQMDEIEEERKKIDLQTNKYIMSSYATSYFAGILGACILITWMYHRVHEGFISYGSLSVIAFLALQVGQSMEGIVDLIPIIMAYMASADRVKILLSIQDECCNAGQKEIEEFIKEGKEKGISVYAENMYFTYKSGYSVFEGASIEAKPGEIVALVGPSGEGKTTMLRVLLGIVSINKGKVFVSNGKSKLDLGIKTRSLISYVPQGKTMMSGTILENLKIVNGDATDSQIEEVLKISCIYDFVMSIPGGLEYKVGQSGNCLSEGQCQRIAIARALLKESPILLMDEATSALDVATERKVLSGIKKRFPNMTIIITTHRPTVLSMCDRVYRIAKKKTNIVDSECIQRLIDEF